MKQNLRKNIIITGIVLLLLIVGFGVYYFIFIEQKNTGVGTTIIYKDTCDMMADSKFVGKTDGGQRLYNIPAHSSGLEKDMVFISTDGGCFIKEDYDRGNRVCFDYDGAEEIGQDDNGNILYKYSTTTKDGLLESRQLIGTPSGCFFIEDYRGSPYDMYPPF